MSFFGRVTLKKGEGGGNLEKERNYKEDRNKQEGSDHLYLPLLLPI